MNTFSFSYFVKLKKMSARSKKISAFLEVVESEVSVSWQKNRTVGHQLASVDPFFEISGSHVSSGGIPAVIIESVLPFA